MGGWLDAVDDIPGTPRGAYWDGGITDYHLHLDYAQMQQGLVLHPTGLVQRPLIEALSLVQSGCDIGIWVLCAGDPACVSLRHRA